MSFPLSSHVTFSNTFDVPVALQWTSFHDSWIVGITAGYSSPGVALQADSTIHNPCSFPTQPKLTPGQP